jgi:hypothetical protein
MLTWILMLAPIVAIIVIYRFYQKKTAEREAASSKRFDEIFGGAAKSSTLAPASSASGAAQITPAPIPVVPQSAWIAKEKFLEPQAKLLYYLLKSGLPDHEVFAQVSLDAVIVAALPLRKPIAGVIDFVVCDKQMKPVAAVGIVNTSGVDGIGDLVKASGVRWVRIAPDALPARGDVRALVLGS